MSKQTFRAANVGITGDCRSQRERKVGMQSNQQSVKSDVSFGDNLTVESDPITFRMGLH